MKKVILALTFFIRWCLTIVFLLDLASVCVSIAGGRPDFYIYPFYKNSVAADEKLFQSYVDAICAQKQCQHKYKVRVFILDTIIFPEYAYVASTTIYFKKSFIEQFSKDEQLFIIGHEIGHDFFKTYDDKVADTFGVSLVGKNTAKRALKKAIAIIAPNDEMANKSIDERVAAIEDNFEKIP